MVLSGRQYREFQHERAEHQQAERRNFEERVRHDPDMRQQARDHVSALDVPGTPDLRPVRVLKVMGLPVWCGTREVISARIQRGEPMNGVARSDDHISRFEVVLPFAEIMWDEVRGTVEERENLSERGYAEVCQECGSDMARYTYRATHHIHGSETVECAECGTVFAHEEWG